jgi:hypothetical protein
MHVSAMAISLLLAVFLFAISNALSPTRILGLGSGFSSVVFRPYSDEASRPVELAHHAYATAK